jgi:hypothetical protein
MPLKTVLNIKKMNIFEILKQDDFYGEDVTIEIAKGLYEYPDSWDNFKRKLKRKYRWLKK